MLFHLSFFIVSIFLVYFDCKKFLVPNELVYTLFFLLLIFGIQFQILTIYNIIIFCLTLIFFVLIMLLKRDIILGGGDIKYMLIISLYLPAFLFPMFLIQTGIVQTLFLIYKKALKKRRVAPMVPAMFLAVCSTLITFKLGFYP